MKDRVNEGRSLVKGGAGGKKISKGTTVSNLPLPPPKKANR